MTTNLLFRIHRKLKIGKKITRQKKNEGTTHIIAIKRIRMRRDIDGKNSVGHFHFSHLSCQRAILALHRRRKKKISVGFIRTNEENAVCRKNLTGILYVRKTRKRFECGYCKRSIKNYCRSSVCCEINRLTRK